MPSYSPVDRFTVPLGGQEIALETVAHEAGGTELLRIRIRERSRFTVFDVDPVTARRFGEALVAWSRPRLGPRAAPGAEPYGQDAPGSDGP